MSEFFFSPSPLRLGEGEESKERGWGEISRCGKHILLRSVFFFLNRFVPTENEAAKDEIVIWLNVSLSKSLRRNSKERSAKTDHLVNVGWSRMLINVRM